MKNTARLFVLLGLSITSLAAAPKKLKPSEIRCDYYLTQMTVNFENTGPDWNSADSGKIVGMELRSRAENNDSVAIELGSDKSKTRYNLRPDSRLDALLIEHKSLFKQSMLSATVFANGLRARVETTRLTSAEMDGEPTLAILQDVVIGADERVLKIETAKFRPTGNTSFALTLDKPKPIRFLLRSEADALIFLAAKKLKLDVNLKSNASDAGAFKEQGYPYPAVAGSRYFAKYHTALPETVNIGTDFIIQGIEQYRSSEMAEGHTEIYIMRNSDKRSIKIISAEYETGMQVLELAAGASAFKLKVTQYEALPGDNQNNQTVNKFEILK